MRESVETGKNTVKQYFSITRYKNRLRPGVTTVFFRQFIVGNYHRENVNNLDYFV